MPRYLLAFALLAGFASTALAASTDTSVAVLGIDPVDVPPELAQQLTVALLSRVSSTPGLHLVQGKDLMEKAKELEKAWDNDQKALQKKSPDVWNQIDKAMDDFIKPLGDKTPDAAKVQAAYDTFIAKLQLAVS